MDIAAFCVEHGRWSAGADGSKFTASTGDGCTEDAQGRLEGEGPGRRVWENVAGYPKKNEVSAPTGTFNALRTDSSSSKEMQAYENHFRLRLPPNARPRG
ncbi:MAG: hypothetical protein IPG92_14275 [Flavobacteriales bacterium]|nr:hypothetical protein [Flavobacteriales bacterium]